MTLIKQHSVSTIALCAALAFSCTQALEVNAEGSASVPTTWSDENYPYQVIDQSLADVFGEFGRNIGIEIEVSQTAGKKRVHRYSHDETAGTFLSYLANEHDIDWIADGRRLFVSSIEERITQSWPGDAGVLEGATAALAGAGLDDPRYRIAVGSDRGVISLTAPPRFMAQALPHIENALAPKATQTVKVIHGRARSGGS